jgi:hypothetical protein
LFRIWHMVLTTASVCDFTFTSDCRWLAKGKMQTIRIMTLRLSSEIRCVTPPPFFQQGFQVWLGSRDSSRLTRIASPT